MRPPALTPFRQRWPLLGLAALLIVFMAALLLGPGAALGQSAPTVAGVAVTSDAGDDDTYILGDVIQITLTFSEAVEVTGTPRLKIDMDPADWGEKQAGYESRSGTDSLVFAHRVVEPNYSTQGIAVLENTLELNGGSIKSAASDTDAELSHDGLAHDPEHKVDWRQSPVTTPTVSAVAITSDAGDEDTYLLGDVIRITLTFSERVNVTGTPQLAIDMDPADWGEKPAAYHSGSGSHSLTFAHEVVQPNISTQGIAVLENSLELNGGSIKSAASDTDAALAHDGRAHDAEHKVDWRRTRPNRAPVVDTEAGNYALFTRNMTVPRSFLVSKPFYQVVTDPDGDELTYSVTIADHHRQLLDEFSIGLDYRTPENSHRSPEVFHRVWFEVDGEDDWKAISPALADPVVVTATLTATDPEGLSVSLDGSILVDWESHPEVVSAVASEQAIDLTFDVAVEADPAPTAEQFTVKVVNGDGTAGTVAVSGVSVNGAVLTLGLGEELASGQTVTVDYAHDDDTPLKRDGEGGDHAASFTGQAVDMSMLGLPGAVANLEVITEPGIKTLLATWDPAPGATSYKLRWRQSGGEFQAASVVTVSDPTGIITVPDYGQWEVQVQGCNDNGCGPEASSTVEVVQATSLRLERAVDSEGNVRSRTLSANWDRVEGAASYTLSWQRLGGDSQANAQVQAQSAAGVRQARSVSAATLSSGQDVDVQTSNQLTFGAEETGAEFTVPDDGAYRAEFHALNDDGELIAMARDRINEAPGQPDTTPPWLVWGEIDGNRVKLYFSEPLDEDVTVGYFDKKVQSGNCICFYGGAGDERIEISGNEVRFDIRGRPAKEGLWASVSYIAKPGNRAGLRDLASNPVSSTREMYLRNITGLPKVTGVVWSSDAGADRFYLDGDTIRVKVNFSESVDVTGTPRLKIDLDPATGGERWADYAGGSGTSNLEFAYTVVEGDFSTQGIAVLANTLELNGGAIRAAWASAVEDARLAHVGRLHNPLHRVVTPNAAPPLLLSASVTGTALTLTFNEPLGAAASLANDAFTVKKTPQGGTEQDVSLSGSPAVSGSTVTLTLASAMLDIDEWVKVSYAKPTAGANNKLVDAGGTEAEDFTDEWVTNTLDTTKPRLVRGEIDGDFMTIYFSEPLDKNSLGKRDYFRLTLRYTEWWPQDGQCPAGSHSFTVRPREVYVSGNALMVDGLSSYEKRRASVKWTLINFIYITDTAVAQRLRDLSGNPVSTPRHRYDSVWETRIIRLENVTRLPYPKSATVNGSRLTLTFSAPMDRGWVPAASAFTVKVNGSAVSLAGSNPCPCRAGPHAKPGRSGSVHRHRDGELRQAGKPSHAERGLRVRAEFHRPDCYQRHHVSSRSAVATGRDHPA